MVSSCVYMARKLFNSETQFDQSLCTVRVHLSKRCLPIVNFVTQICVTFVLALFCLCITLAFASVSLTLGKLPTTSVAASYQAR